MLGEWFYTPSSPISVENFSMVLPPSYIATRNITADLDASVYFRRISIQIERY